MPPVCEVEDFIMFRNCDLRQDRQQTQNFVSILD